MIGCLIVHGFTGTPEEVKDIQSHFQKEAWLVYTPELPGHNGTRQALKESNHREWIYKAQVALEELLKRCSRVYVIGFSMGGVIAGYLAARYPVDRLVLISSSVFYLNPKQIAEDVTGWALEGFRGELADNDVYRFYREKVRRTPVEATVEFARLVKRLRHAFEEIDVPTLIVQGEKDGLVPARSAQYIFDKIRSEEKQLYYLEQAKHYIWFGEQKEDFLEKLEAFLTAAPTEKSENRRDRDSHDEDRSTETIHF
ncbi:alpha/beta fold hydrolase [Alkalicoccus chagannorensis]|uniref:alpha/beta fold hydrolase n=1 Tax=Alkalicoccus chagannorensis TaxID=427072 RepID=UPI0004057A77